MAASQTVQGTLNRVRGSITFPDFPELNITAPFLGDEGINMSPEGNIVGNIGTMTGTVTSPEPYQMMSVDVELLKSQSFSDLFKRQLEDNAVIGDFFVRVDAPTLSNYQIFNGSIAAASPGRINGRSVSYMITLRGYYQINSSLYDAA